MRGLKQSCEKNEWDSGDPNWGDPIAQGHKAVTASLLADAIAALRSSQQPRQADETACLNAIASNEPCKPDDTLRRCTLCGFIVDTKYKVEFPQ